MAEHELSLEELEAALSLSERTVEAFNARLETFTYEWPDASLDVSARFYHLTLREGLPSTDLFLTYLSEQVVPFCIPYQERKAALDAAHSTGDYAHVTRLIQKARDLFVKARTRKTTTGEPGELILFLILECALKAPQIACKMYLKTARNVPVHGADSVHVAYDSGDDSLLIYWGESKLQSNLTSAIHNIVESVANFISEDASGESSKHRDIEIICDHGTLSGPYSESLKEKVLVYFDPYHTASNYQKDIYACLACFDLPLYEELKTLDSQQARKLFQERYANKIENACHHFSQDLHAKELTNLRFAFFLLPFESVQSFRESFLTKIGLPTHAS